MDSEINFEKLKKKHTKTLIGSTVRNESPAGVRNDEEESTDYSSSATVSSDDSESSDLKDQEDELDRLLSEGVADLASEAEEMKRKMKKHSAELKLLNIHRRASDIEPIREDDQTRVAPAASYPDTAFAHEPRSVKTGGNDEDVKPVKVQYFQPHERPMPNEIVNEVNAGSYTSPEKKNDLTPSDKLQSKKEALTSSEEEEDDEATQSSEEEDDDEDDDEEKKLDKIIAKKLHMSVGKIGDVPDSTVENDSIYTPPAAMSDGSSSRLLKEQEKSLSRNDQRKDSPANKPVLPHLARGESYHGGISNKDYYKEGFPLTDTPEDSPTSERKPRHEPGTVRNLNASSLNYLRSLSTSRARVDNDRKAMGVDVNDEEDLKDNGGLITNENMAQVADLEEAMDSVLEDVATKSSDDHKASTTGPVTLNVAEKPEAKDASATKVEKIFTDRPSDKSDEEESKEIAKEKDETLKKNKEDNSVTDSQDHNKVAAAKPEEKSIETKVNEVVKNKDSDDQNPKKTDDTVLKAEDSNGVTKEIETKSNTDIKDSAEMIEAGEVTPSKEDSVETKKSDTIVEDKDSEQENNKVIQIKNAIPEIKSLETSVDDGSVVAEKKESEGQSEDQSYPKSTSEVKSTASKSSDNEKQSKTLGSDVENKVTEINVDAKGEKIPVASSADKLIDKGEEDTLKKDSTATTESNGVEKPESDTTKLKAGNNEIASQAADKAKESPKGKEVANAEKENADNTKIDEAQNATTLGVENEGGSKEESIEKEITNEEKNDANTVTANDTDKNEMKNDKEKMEGEVKGEGKDEKDKEEKKDEKEENDDKDENDENNENDQEGKDVKDKKDDENEKDEKDVKDKKDDEKDVKDKEGEKNEKNEKDEKDEKSEENEKNEKNDEDEKKETESEATVTKDQPAALDKVETPEDKLSKENSIENEKKEKATTEENLPKTNEKEAGEMETAEASNDDIEKLIAEVEKEQKALENKSRQTDGNAGGIRVAKQQKLTFENEPVYLYTSFAGGMQVASRTRRMETILAANKIKFEYKDMGTDPQAKRVWRTFSGGKALPGIVRGKDDFIGNWEDVEEANEDYAVRQLIYETY